MIEIDDYQMVPRYLELISDYINYHDDVEEFKKNFKSLQKQNKMISFLMYDQLRNISPIINSLGRLIVLYDTQESLFKQEFGLVPKQILLFYHIMSSIPTDTEPLNKDLICSLLQELDSSIKNKMVNKFLDIFAISVKNYRLGAKSLGITKYTVKNKRLIMEYPIIEYNNMYIVPSSFVLLESLSYKIFNKINTTDNRIRAFGDTFENYIRDMSKYFHESYFHECTGLIEEGKKGNKKAEFFLENDELSLVIEAKVLHINDAIVSSANIESIENKFKNTVVDALRQLDSCSKKLTNMYSIIVVHTHLPVINVFIESIKKSKRDKYLWLDKMVLLTVIDYENLISLPLNEIVEKIKELQDTSFNLISGKENEYLQNKYSEYIDPIVSAYEEEPSS